MVSPHPQGLAASGRALSCALCCALVTLPVRAAVPPELDPDGDGIPSAADECPQQAGRPELGGCPQTGAAMDWAVVAQVQQILEQARSLTLAGKPMDAALKAGEAVRIAPRMPEGYRFRSEVYARLGQTYAPAARFLLAEQLDLQRTLELDPAAEDRPLRLQRSQQLTLQIAEVEKAEARQDRAAKAMPFLLGLGMTFMMVGAISLIIGARERNDLVEDNEDGTVALAVGGTFLGLGGLGVLGSIPLIIAFARHGRRFAAYKKTFEGEDLGGPLRGFRMFRR